MSNNDSCPRNELQTETLDKLYLEISQFTRAKTGYDISNERRIAKLEEELEATKVQLGKQEKKTWLSQQSRNAALDELQGLAEEWVRGLIVTNVSGKKARKSYGGDECADQLTARIEELRS